MTIKGNRVDLRPHDNSLLSHLFKWHEDPAFDEAMTLESGPKSELHLKTIYDRYLPPRGRLFTIHKTGEKDTIGIVALHEIDLINRKAEIILGIGEGRGNGFGTDALSLMVDWAVDQLGLQRIYSSVISGNEASMKMLVKAGFKKEAEFKNEIYRDGTHVNRIVYGYNLASTLPISMFKSVAGFVENYKETTGKNIHGGHIELLNSFCEFVRKAGD